MSKRHYQPCGHPAVKVLELEGDRRNRVFTSEQHRGRPLGHHKQGEDGHSFPDKFWTGAGV